MVHIKMTAKVNYRSNKEIALTFYSLLPCENDRYECKCGNKRTRKDKSGWQNLIDHIEHSHQEEYKLLKETPLDGNPNQQNITNFYRTISVHSEKTKKIHGWVDWVSTHLRPFSFVEEVCTRNYSNLPEISVTLSKKTWNALQKE